VRFDAIGEGCKLVLRAASIFGQSFLAAGVKALVGDMHDEDVDRWLEILVDKEILFSRPLGSIRQHVFRHALLHQAAYAMLTPKDEVSGHYLAADFLEKSGEREAIILADHYEKGEQPAHAIRWLRVAANQAMEVDDLAAALARVGRGVRLGAQGDDLAELRVVESEARYWRGEYEEAERAAREARNCTDPKLYLRAITALIDGLGPQAKYDEIARLTDLLEERPTDPKVINSWLDCRYSLASYLAAAGHSEWRTRTLELLDSERSQLNPVLIARTQSMRAHLAWEEGRRGDMVALFQEAATLFETAGHRRAAAEAFGNVGSGLMEVGQLDEAETQMRKLWATAERMGLNHMLGGTYYMLCNILVYKGRIDEARDFAARAINWTTHNGEKHFLTYATLYASMIEHTAGDFLAAEKYARHGLQMVSDNPLMHPFAQALLAQALMGQTRIEDALPLAEAAYGDLERLGKVQDGEATISLVFAKCLIAKSDNSRARDIIRRAVEKLHSIAATISVVSWRSSFLNCIPEHRRLLELSEAISS
jgi:eukaryotic-like serine/threonine-protein kinase